ncbi:hypothetical protein [Spongiibacter sp. UBA1325]|uniref:hypothetical protein n=1 Tax=Spongiibacter sp. UBA1325 TaxID=1947543 RepID=UPI002579976E|nr:hypothetical protein [Spongiibacter sp. UBA1325]
MNMQIPEELYCHAGDCTLLLPYWHSDQAFYRVLTAWEIPEEEIDAFKPLANIVDVKHAIQMSQLLLVMQNSVNTLEWLHANNLHFNSTTPWSQIKMGNAATVFEYLMDRVFGPWSPHLNAFQLMKGGDDA